MRGVATGTLVAFSVSILVMGWFLMSGNSRVRLTLTRLPLSQEMFFDILKVGAISVFSPLQSVVTITILTSHARALRHRGAGRLRHRHAARIHADVDRVRGRRQRDADGRHGDRREPRRAGARVAWTAAAVAFVSLGVIGTLLSIFPDLWVSMFTDDPAVRDAGRRYLHISSPMLGFIGLNMALYFSSQGAAKIIGPVLSQTGRLIFIAVGGSLADVDQRHRHQLLHPGRSLDGDAGADHRARRSGSRRWAPKPAKALSFSPPAALSHRSHDELRGRPALLFFV